MKQDKYKMLRGSKCGHTQMWPLQRLFKNDQGHYVDPTSLLLRPSDSYERLHCARCESRCIGSTHRGCCFVVDADEGLK